MLHQGFSTPAPHNWQPDYVEICENQDRLALFCHDWKLPTPKYKYARRGSQHGQVVGYHSSVIVNEIEYTSTLADTDWHPGWGSHNDARESVAGEVLRALGLDLEDDHDTEDESRQYYYR